MSLYIWADTHFNHEGIIKHTSRPFETVQEMNNWLIELWNGQVRRESDLVWFLGDFGFHAPNKGGAMDLGQIFWKLKGIKHLVIGNHDVKNTQVLRLPWQEVVMLKEIKHDRRRATVCHYPLETWPGAWRGNLMLHGHCHGTLKRKLPKRFDVGFDTELGKNGPINWDYLCELAQRERFVPVDGHVKGEM